MLHSHPHSRTAGNSADGIDVAGSPPAAASPAVALSPPGATAARSCPALPAHREPDSHPLSLAEAQDFARREFTERSPPAPATVPSAEEVEVARLFLIGELDVITADGIDRIEAIEPSEVVELHQAILRKHAAILLKDAAIAGDPDSDQRPRAPDASARSFSALSRVRDGDPAPYLPPHLRDFNDRRMAERRERRLADEREAERRDEVAFSALPPDEWPFASDPEQPLSPGETILAILIILSVGIAMGYGLRVLVEGVA